jgi:hypothetical protein
MSERRAQALGRSLGQTFASSAPRPRVTIVGGGLAALLLGNELLRRRPELEVRLVTEESPSRCGGHLASWSEGGYPVEHGFHALFSCYDTARCLLENHGLFEQFVPGPAHFFVYRDGALAKARNGLLALLPPLSTRESLDGLASVPGVLAACLAAVASERAREALDREELRDALRRRGAGPRVVESALTRLFYDVGFVGERPLSAAVGLSLLFHLVRGGRMLHFPKPSREALIEPLREKLCAAGGSLVEATRLGAVGLEPSGRRVRWLELEELATGAVRRELVDEGHEVVLAVDVESMKKLAFAGGPAPAFVRDVQTLEGVVSLSLQAFFDDDPVPSWIDSVLGGLPEPWSTICPVSRVRRQRGRGTHGYELIACGPESGFEGASDEALVERFFDTLERVGIAASSARARCHVVMRRNGRPSERYLGTYPGGLARRPRPTGTGVDNLSLAGAWLRVPFSIPSVEAVSQSVVAVREHVLARLAHGAHERPASETRAPAIHDEYAHESNHLRANWLAREG